MTLASLLRRAAPYRWTLLLVSAISLASSAAMLAIPWLSARFLGDMLTAGRVPAEGVLALLLLAIAANAGFAVAAANVSARVSGQMLADLRCEIYAHVQSLPIAYHDLARQGDLLALMTYEVSHLSRFLTTSLVRVPGMTLTALGSVILLFVIDPLVALVVPALIPVFFVLVRLVGRRLRQLSEHARQADAWLMTQAEEDLAMLPAIKAFAVEQARRERYGRIAQAAFASTLKVEQTRAVLGPVVSLIAAVAAVVLLLIADGRAAAAARSPAELLSLLLYAALLTRPISGFAELYGSLQWARGTLGRLAAVLEVAPEEGLSEMVEDQRVCGAITFAGVRFSYPERADLFDDLDLTVEAGEIVALTGLNGAGKSTLINLLLRFYLPQAGQISLDQRDIAGWPVQSLRRQFGLVPQRPMLFNGSLRTNIVLGRAKVSDAMVARALDLAQAAAFVDGLPDGLETEIGDHGVRLSGGQRQRVALARALLTDPPILIFDEATAMYDLSGEEAFIAACKGALTGRTVLIVTHRPASLALADRVVRIEGGKAREG